MSLGNQPNHFEGTRRTPRALKPNAHMRGASSYYGKDKRNGYGYRNSNSIPGKLQSESELLNTEFNWAINPRDNDAVDLNGIPLVDRNLTKLASSAKEYSGVQRVKLSSSIHQNVAMRKWKSGMMEEIVDKYGDKLSKINLPFKDPKIGARINGLIKLLQKQKVDLKKFEKVLKEKKAQGKEITDQEKKLLETKRELVTSTKSTLLRNFSAGDLSQSTLNNEADSGGNHAVMVKWFFDQPETVIPKVDKEKFKIKSQKELKELLDTNPSLLKAIIESLEGYVEHLGDAFPKDLNRIIEEKGGLTSLLSSSVLAGGIFTMLANSREGFVPGALFGAVLNFPALFTNENGGPSKAIGVAAGAFAGAFFSEWSGKGAMLGAAVLNPDSIGFLLKSIGALASTATMTINHGVSGRPGLIYGEWDRFGLNVKRYALNIVDPEKARNYGNHYVRFGAEVQRVLRNDIKNAPEELKPLLNHIKFIETGEGKELKGAELENALKLAGEFSGKIDPLSTDEDNSKIMFQAMQPGKKMTKDEKLKYQLYYADILKGKVAKGILVDPNLGKIFDKSYEKGAHQFKEWEKAGNKEEINAIIKKLTKRHGETFAIEGLKDSPAAENVRLALNKKISPQGYEFLKGATSTLSGTLLTAYFMMFMIANLVQFAGGKFNKFGKEKKETRGEAKDLKTFFDRPLDHQKRENINKELKKSKIKTIGDVYKTLNGSLFSKKGAILSVVPDASILKRKFDAENPEEFKAFMDLFKPGDESSPAKIRASFYEALKSIAKPDEKTNLEINEKKEILKEKMQKIKALGTASTASIDLGDGNVVEFYKPSKWNLPRWAWRKGKFLSKRIPVKMKNDDGKMKTRYLSIYQSGGEIKYKITGGTEKKLDVAKLNIGIINKVKE